ncbi:hypothetical protein JCM6882_004533, partial [Rhodosporidiobolus microsporus]
MSIASYLPSLASVTLSIPPIAALVLSHLVALSPSTDILKRPPYYTDLCTLSLVSRAFRSAAVPHFHARILFNGGARQQRQWLRAQSSLRPRGVEVETKLVVLLDERPFRLAEEGEEGEEGRAKWSRPVLREVCSRLRGVKELWVAWWLAKEFPVKCLEGQNWKDLVYLRLDCPLSPPPSSNFELPFRLEVLTCSDAPSSPLSRSWFPTFSLLAPTLHHIPTTLNLAPFRHFLYEPFLSPSYLLPSASSLAVLSLPSLTLNPSSYNLALFALCCPSLEELSLHPPITAEAILELLPYFSAPPLKRLSLSGLEGVLGAGIVHPLLLQATDPVNALCDVLKTWPAYCEGGLETVEVRRLRVVTGPGCLPHLRLIEMRRQKGFWVEYSFDERYDPGLTEEE